MAVTLTFLGTGDAFGSGGRFHTCMLAASGETHFLIDCGASAITAIQQRGVDTGRIGFVLLSHLHGDHFGGLPYLVLDAHFVRRRGHPLVVAGPPGTRARFEAMMETLYAGFTGMSLGFPLEFAELAEGEPQRLGGVTVTPYLVRHACGAPPFALRVECGGRRLAYSGDTEWTDALIAAARGTDLMVCECNEFERKIPYHLDLRTLAAHRRELETRRLIMTHLGPAMLARLDALPFEHADDGMTVEV